MTGQWRLRARGALVLVSAAVAAGLPAAPVGAASTGQAPAYVETLGGSGKADMYPSGAEVAPDGTLVVADTGSNEIEKYRADGSLVWRTGSYGAGTGQFNNPRDIGIDSLGNIYVADTANLRIVKLTPAGGWISSTKGAAGDPVKSPIGLSVSNDLVYVADGATKKVRVFTTSLTQTRAFGSNGACTFSALRDVDADAQGNVYVANYTLHNILKLTSTGTCITKWGGKGTADGQFAAPYGVRIARDPGLDRQLAYVADSNNNRIQVFELGGAHLATIAGPGTHDQLGTFTQLRRVAVAADGDIWGADLWGWRMERSNRAATVNSRPTYTAAQRIGNTIPQLTDSAVFHEPRQVAVDNDGNLRIADTVHHRIVRMTPAGRVLDACGLRGSDDGELNWPRGVAVDPVSGDIWMADTKQSRLQVIPPGCVGGERIGTKGTGVGNFNWPMSVAIRRSDRTAWVADTNNNRIVVWDVATRTPIRAFGTAGSGTGQFSQPRGITVAPDGRILVADRSNNRIIELAATAGAQSVSVTRTITGKFRRPEGVAVDTSDRIYVANTQADRLDILNPDGTVLGTTTGPDGLQDPASVTVSNGRIYVSDTMGDRIQVFAWGPAPVPDAQGPTATISSPAANATVSAPVTLSGGATDNVAVAAVEVAVQDRTTLQWWRSDGTWGAKAFHPTSLSAPNAASVTWSTTFAGGSGDYLLQVRAKDSAGNVSSPLATRRFSVS